MNSYPLWLLAVPDTQPSLFPEVDEERKDLRYWREVFLRAIKPKLEKGEILCPEEREQCRQLGIPIPQWVAVSVERSAFMGAVVDAAQKFGGVLADFEHGWWTGCGDGVRRSKKCLGMEFRFASEEEAEKFIEYTEGEETLLITGLDTTGLSSPYWMNAEGAKWWQDFEKSFKKKTQGEEQ